MVVLIIAVLLGILLLITIARYYYNAAMAGFMGWFVGSVIGADRQRDSTKKLNNGVQLNGDIQPVELKLSRPINQIIEETFREEFAKLSNNTSQKRRCRKRANAWRAVGEVSGATSGRSNETEASAASVEDMKLPSASAQIRVLSLHRDEHQDSTLYRLKKGWGLQFRLGPSLFGKRVVLYCNYPIEGGVFERNRYYCVKWTQEDGCSAADDTALCAFITAELSGSFHYYFTYEDCENNEPRGSGFFIVDPILRYGEDEELPLDCIQCQTVLAKSLGAFSTWERKLLVGKESGYNMFHFTPIQELGASNSSYSLSEQLKLNPIFSDKQAVAMFEDVQEFIAKIRKEWKVISICDIVLNHTANESTWLLTHPETTYNCQNCPYMRPAYLLDTALHLFSLEVKSGAYENNGIPTEISTEEHLNAIKHTLFTSLLPKLKLQEMYICDVAHLVAQFSSLARSKVANIPEDNTDNEELIIVQDIEYRRLQSTVDMKIAMKLYNIYRNDCFDEETRIKKCTEDFKSKLDALNQIIVDQVNEDLRGAVENCISGIRYFRVQNDGPRVAEISETNPLVYRYFTDYGRADSLQAFEELMYGPDSKYLMAHNGWVMNADPLHNFASNAKVYLRRELIAWSDSVKLRYGEKPDDCPYLWRHMREYVESIARIFDGVRLDNCHSTPIPVAEYLLDCARRVRPDLYVVAELFTNSEREDNIFVNRLGISSLIREAMSAWDSHEQGRLVYRYGGEPVGAFYQPNIRPLVPSIAHALFLDLTHDNPSPVEKRSVFDLLPSTALVNMACCASGSNRGYDELVPHHIHVVDEIREYSEWSEKDSEDAKYVSSTNGLISVKKAINDLHFYLGSHGFNQVYVDQIDQDIVAVTRHNPITHESVILVAFTAFKHPAMDEAYQQRYVKPLRVEGELDEIILEASLRHKTGSKYDKTDNYTKNNRYINGFTDYEVVLKQHIKLKQSDVLKKSNSGDCNTLQLDFADFKPGSVVAIKVSLPEKVNNAVKNLRNLINKFPRRNINDFNEITSKVTLADLNRTLYRCDQEERDDGNGFGAYDIPNSGPIVYCGLQGLISLFANIRANNDLGHPVCANLRDGNWLIEYISARLKVDEGTKELGVWIENSLDDLSHIPRYLIPAYFDVIVTSIYLALVERSYDLMSDFVRNGSSFVKGLALGSVQFGAVVKSAVLPKFSADLNGGLDVTLSAGLPHFSTGYTRNWGRDTFIALRGLFIVTGRFEDARRHILAYAACLRQGLIPNLLDGGNNSRFNCRDAVWWWLYCIQCYVQEVPNGELILKDNVSRIFPQDDSEAQEPGAVEQPLHDIMQEALEVHFQGLAFRERNAGRKIDEHMTDRGFNNQIGVHPETGFVFGGNEANCGTWMDKMGSSQKAGIKGKPATPRDGSAVELIGLSKAVITWLAKMNVDGKYPYGSVKRTNKTGSFAKWTFEEWAEKISANFEQYFWIPTSSDIHKHEIKEDLVNKKGIYKDSVNASQPWADYQFRCNFPIAMVAAPEMFDAQNAWTALVMAEEHLLGPLGMKTLDSSDWNYCGDYDNSNDSDDPKVAHGFNYHQGPEWIWPIGYYLRAKLIFAAKVGKLNETIASTKEVLSAHFTELQTSPWRGLPELTNTNGSYCNDSSRTQAWSMSCVLEVLHDLQRIETKQAANTN